ncbi:MAG: protein phosphatase 2C family protein [Myxococcales bacterium]|nr:protein phosphatase 2C family protein [Myxococcales bacterium]
MRHVGEVRACALSRGRVTRLTTDDTFPMPTGGWILTRSLGLGRDEPTVTRVSLDGVSDLLLCSSGAHRHADDASFDVLSQDWSRPAQAIDVLRRARAGDPGSGLVAHLRL